MMNGRATAAPSHAAPSHIARQRRIGRCEFGKSSRTLFGIRCVCGIILGNWARVLSSVGCRCDLVL